MPLPEGLEGHMAQKEPWGTRIRYVQIEERPRRRENDPFRG